MSLIRQDNPGERCRFVVMCVATAGLLIVLGVALGSGLPDVTKQVLSDTMFVFGAGTAALCSAWRARQRGSDRSAWSFIAVATASWTVGNCFWFYYQLIAPSQPFPSLSDPFYLLFFPLVTIGLIKLAPGSLGRDPAIRAILDGVLIAASLFFASWALVLGDAVRASGLSFVGKAVYLTNPTGDVIIGSLALLLVVRARPGRRLPLVLLGSGLLAYAVADSGYAYLSNRGEFRIGTVLDLGWIAGYLLVALAALAPRSVDADDTVEQRTVAGGAIGLFPLVIAAFVAAGTDVVADPILIASGVVVVLAFVARHLLMLQENAALNRGLANILDDRTAELERVTTRTESILASAADGIYGIDLDGRIVFANPAAAAMLGYEADDLIGRAAHATIHHSREDGSPYPAEECGVLAALVDRLEHRIGDEVYFTKDGGSFSVDCVATPLVEDDTVVGAVIVFRDVTERREVDRMKEEFISVVSHELRTPLTSIRGSLGLLAGGALGQMPERGGRMLEIAVDNTDRLIRLINDILDVERIRSGKAEMEFQPASPADAVEAAVDLLRPMAEASGVQLIVRGDDFETRVWADPDRLAQTLTNLVGNAIKFSPDNATVTVAWAEMRGMMAFSVSDQGRGVPMRMRDAIFAPFQQVDASDARDKGGTGLGLAICRSIVDQHGGRIWVDQATDGGADFHFTLPLADRYDTGAGLVGGSTGPVVVVCDDDDSVREVVTVMLCERGYRVAPVASGTVALAAVRQHRAAAIVLDMVMPGMDGWEVMRELKAEPSTAHVAVVALTVVDPSGRDGEGVADAWITKPLDTSAFLSAVHAATHPNEIAKVLLVEDDSQLAAVLTTQLRSVGFDVRWSAGGHEALREASQWRPDLVILDVGLPDIDGFTVVDELRADGRLAQVPLVVYSARELKPGERDRLRLGETAFLTKGRDGPGELERRAVLLLDRMRFDREDNDVTATAAR